MGGSGGDGQVFKQFKEKSTWVPEKVDPAIQVYCSKLEEKICGLNCEGKNYSNFPLEEINALKQLKGYKDIVIKEAGKGSAV